MNAGKRGWMYYERREVDDTKAVDTQGVPNESRSVDNEIRKR